MMYLGGNMQKRNNKNILEEPSLSDATIVLKCIATYATIDVIVKVNNYSINIHQCHHVNVVAI